MVSLLNITQLIVGANLLFLLTKRDNIEKRFIFQDNYITYIFYALIPHSS